jgi:hypothetical protein
MAKLIVLGSSGRTVTVTKRFNDNDFPYPSDLSLLYERTSVGIDHVADKTVIFCGLCRDVLDTIADNIQYLDLIGSYFKSHLILLYESDSTDETPKKLKELGETYPLIFESEKLDLPRYTNDEKERTRILSYCRNWYLNHITANKLTSDYVVVIDCDSNGWSLPGFFTSFSYPDFDMMGANGIQHGEYYDTFPLRIENWTDYFFRGIENKQATTPRHIVFSRENELQPVLSCFGGLGIYKFEALMSSYYAEFEGSEHVYLHRRMVEQGYDKIFINPQMLYLR